LADREAAGVGIPLPIRLGEWDVAAWKHITSTARHMHADLIHAQTSHAHSLALHAARNLQIPLVVSRRVDFPVAINFFSRRKYLHPAVHYIAISHAIKRVLINGGVAEEKIHVVHSGIDPNRYPHRGQTRDEELARHWGAAAEVPLIVNAAALTDHKDQATLLRAAAILKSDGIRFRLIIAGSGELETELNALRNELSLQEEVHFPGYVNLDTLYPAADLFVISSHLEGLCTSILDAMAVGIPVVATRTGGIPEIVQHEQNGLLAPPRDPAALAAQMKTLLESPNRALQYQAAARHTVAQHFTNQKMADGVISAYGKILGTRATTPAKA
jgi:glycosyltransferase involved in cell wall biosynthesis